MVGDTLQLWDGFPRRATHIF